jgi:LPXTG-site transpeptidase (sortase) family protein
MRNIGVLFILVIIGMLFWKAVDRNDPVQAARVGSSSSIVDSYTDILSNGYKTVPVNNLEDESNDPGNLEFELTSTDQNTNHYTIRRRIFGGRYRDKSHESSQSAKDYERIVIPSLKINASIVSKPYSELTWDLTNLGHDVAFLTEVPNQTTDKNSVLAGHVTVRNGSHGPFRYLWKMSPGDEIVLHDENLIYTYVVREQVLVYPEDSYVLNDTPQPQITLITCTTWDEETLSYLRRLIVFADLEKVEARRVIVD